MTEEECELFSCHPCREPSPTVSDVQLGRRPGLCRDRHEAALRGRGAPCDPRRHGRQSAPSVEGSHDLLSSESFSSPACGQGYRM